MEKIHPETGKILHRDVRAIEFAYKGERIFVDMPGWYPDDDSDGVFTHEDMIVSDQALRILKARHAAKISQNNFSDDNLAFA